MSRYRTRPDFDLGPYEDEYRGFDDRGDEQARGPLILVLALGVLLIFAGVIWNTYRQGVRPSEGGLPVFASASETYKEVPEDQGGLEVAGSDRGFYGLMDGAGSDMATDLARSAGMLDLDGAPPEFETRKTVSIETAPSLRQTQPVEKDFGEDRQIRVATLTPGDRLEAGAPAEVDVSTPDLPVSTDSVVEKPPQSRFVADGAYQVQLLASRSEAAAAQAWVQIRQQNPRLFTGAELDIQRADLGSRGVFYRLRVNAFADRDSAASFCGDVKAQGRDCIVVSRQEG